jgi:DNA transposition AAA+ family ATPase
MNSNQKTEIQKLLRDFVETFNSQRQAISHLRGTSEATVINILSNKWESISDDMWRNIGKQVGWQQQWNLVETMAMITLISFYADAKDYGNVFALIGNAGSGKSAVAEWYSKSSKNVVLVSCKEYWNRKEFLKKIIEKMGKDHSGMNVTQLMDYIVDCFLKMDQPLLILDEFDKLSDQLLFFFIALYNELKGKCGIVIQGAPFLKIRIEKGRDRNKKGYAEIFSRIGRKYVTVHNPNDKEIEQICVANGVSEAIHINEIRNQCDGDLRRVERLVHKAKITKNKNRVKEAA